MLNSFTLVMKLHLTDELRLVLGGRFDDFEFLLKDDAGKSGGDAPSRKDKEFSPRLGLVYKPENNVTYYASYSESFLPKSGDQYADLKGTNTKQKTDPDIYENTEFGVQI